MALPTCCTAHVCSSSSSWKLLLECTIQECCHIFWGDYRWGMTWILHLLTQLGTTSNYNTIADLHTLQISSTR
jgi:hypothetical protein